MYLFGMTGFEMFTSLQEHLRDAGSQGNFLQDLINVDLQSHSLFNNAKSKRADSYWTNKCDVITQIEENKNLTCIKFLSLRSLLGQYFAS